MSSGVCPCPPTATRTWLLCEVAAREAVTTAGVTETAQATAGVAKTARATAGVVETDRRRAAVAGKYEAAAIWAVALVAHTSTTASMCADIS
jgi:hypothetical protein